MDFKEEARVQRIASSFLRGICMLSYERRVILMNKIYIEVPKNTNEATVSVPCRNEELLWQFHVVFSELEHLKTRIVTVIDNNCESEPEGRFRNQVVTNKNNRWVVFDYAVSEDDFEMKIKISVHFCKNIRMIEVSW